MAVELVYRGGVVKDAKVIKVLEDYIAEGNITASEVGAAKEPLYCEITMINNKKQCNKTFAEMWAAHEEGREVICKADAVNNIRCEFIQYANSKEIFIRWINGLKVFTYTIREDDTYSTSEYSLTTIEQGRGSDTYAVMSQDAVTKELKALEDKVGGGTEPLLVSVIGENTVDYSATEITTAYLEGRNVFLMMESMFIPLTALSGGEIAVFTLTMVEDNMLAVLSITVDANKNYIMSMVDGSQYQTAEQVNTAITTALNNIGVAEEGAY